MIITVNIDDHKFTLSLAMLDFYPNFIITQMVHDPDIKCPFIEKVDSTTFYMDFDYELFHDIVNKLRQIYFGSYRMERMERNRPYPTYTTKLVGGTPSSSIPLDFILSTFEGSHPETKLRQAGMGKEVLKHLLFPAIPVKTT